MGQFIREKSTGHLHRVRILDNRGYHTIRVYDGQRCLVAAHDAIKIKHVSQFPGDFGPESRAA